MAMSRNVVTCLAVAALLMTVAKAKSYTVGDDDGWTAGPDYTTWTSRKTFKVGDELVFTYLSNHDVLEVLKKDYDTCSASSPISSDNSGSTTIALTALGKRYFICGTPGHCDNGQKLEVDTLGSSSSPPPPAATSSPPPVPTTPPPSISPPVVTPPPVATPPPATPPRAATPPPSSPPKTSPPTITPASPPVSSPPSETTSPNYGPTVPPTSTPKTSSPPPSVSKVAPPPPPSSAYKISHGAFFAFALMMLAAIF